MMSALAASGSYFPFGDYVSMSISSHLQITALFHKTLPLFIKVGCETRPLTLTFLGLKSEIETTCGNEKNRLQQGVSTMEFPKGKAKKVGVSKERLVGAKKSPDIPAALFAAQSFSELGLPPLLVGRLEKEGFKVPTDVQAAAIPVILMDHDVVIQSYTGSGKTLAYLLPILSGVGPLKKNSSTGDESKNKTEIEAVIVAPSRELWMQIVRETGSAACKRRKQIKAGRCS